MKELLSFTQMPTIKEMARTNARVIVSQSESMKPEWFHHQIGAEKRKEDRRKERILKDKKERYIPKHFAKIIEGTLMHELLELAWLNSEQVREGFNRSGSNFVKVWGEAEKGWAEFKESEDYTGESEAVFTRLLFSNLCKLEMDVLCTNKRRLMCKTPSKRLIANNECKTVPPIWEPKNPKPLEMVLSCQSDYPSVPSRYWSKRHANSGEDSCRICGCRIDMLKEQDEVNRPSECVDCGAKVHTKCCHQIGLCKEPPYVFKCSEMTRFLRPGAVELPMVVDCVEALESRCLVCGDEDERGAIMCAKECGAWAHKDCHGVSVGVLQQSRINARKRKDFTCNEVKWNVRKSDVREFSIGRKSKRKREKLESVAVPWKKSGIGRKRRFTKISSDYKCEFCNETVHIGDENHELEYCSAFKSKPVFGSKNAFTPTKRARIVEFTSKKLKLDSFRRNPPESNRNGQQDGD
jgi:hypothetical protein